MAADEERQFRVWSSHSGRHHAHTVSETTFEAAAVACLERWHAVIDGEIVIIVRDVLSGVEHCFRMELETDVAGPFE